MVINVMLITFIINIHIVVIKWIIIAIMQIIMLIVKIII